jgi:hypothetical protein
MHAHTEALSQILPRADRAVVDVLLRLHQSIAELPADDQAHALFAAMIDRACELGEGNRNGRVFFAELDQAHVEVFGEPLPEADEPAPAPDADHP